MTSPVEIANAALTLLGAERITTLDDASVAAETMKAGFDLIRDRELQAHPWKFATRRASLPALAAAPAYGPARQFLVPDGFLRLLEVDGQWVASPFSDELPFTLEAADEGNVIATNLGAPLLIRYTYRVTDTGLFAPAFSYALACALADFACEAITQSTPKQQLMAERYERSISRARRLGAVEMPSRGLMEGYFDRSRA